MRINSKTMIVVSSSAAALVGLFGTVIVLMTLERGVWADEFLTLAWTQSGTSPGEMLRLMITRDVHPLLYYGMIYLPQTVGMTDIALLRSINLLGLPIVLFAVAYGIRHKAINLSQGLVVWILFASSPIFFDYFAELRCYFLVYSVSIAISIIWYVLIRQLEANQKVSSRMTLIWVACLAVFVNLHYFATIFGGALTIALLLHLVIRRLWSQAFLIASVSLAAAVPALVFGTLQVLAKPLAYNTSWIDTGPIESIKMTLRIAENATAWNLAVVASAVATCLFVLEDRKKWVELRTAVKLLAVIVLFLIALVLINAISPLLVDRYLIACAGAVTFSVAILAASFGTPVWLPTVASAIALLLQAQTLRTNLNFSEARGWLPSAKAVAKLKSECPATKIYAYPTYHFITNLNELDIGMKFYTVAYGYYAKKFNFSVEYFQPGTVVASSGACPSVIWIEHTRQFFEDNPLASVEQVISEYHIDKVGTAELRRYGSGALIVVH